MNWTMLDTWIVVAGVLSAMSCALVGNFLLLRRMSMMGDAISHAVLPGLAVAFLLTASRGSLTMFVGAAVVGVLTAMLTQWIHTLGKVEESASMGVVFSILFAIGLILIVRGADAVDLDPGCVLYGAIELTPLDTVRLFGWQVPRAVVMLGSVMLLNVLFVLLFYKELRISAFDPALATTLGIPAGLMHYLLMTLVAITAVASFESVGSILVIAMLIVPAAAAHLLVDRYAPLLLVSLLLAAASALLGHIGAITVPTWFGYADTSTAGMMAVAAGALFAVTMLVAPRHGVLSRLAHRLALSVRIAREDMLGLLYRMEESKLGQSATATAAQLRYSPPRGAVVFRLALWTLRGRGRLRRRNGSWELSESGRREAGQIVRAHRLWESYVDKHFELPADHLHTSAERAEHFISPDMDEAMARDLQDTRRDPHGRPIPDLRDTGDAPSGSSAPQE